MMRIQQFTALLFLALLSQAQADDAPQELTPAQVFLQVCATTYGRTAQVEALVQRLSLNQLPESEAEEFLDGKSGKAWSGSIGGNVYTVVSEQSGLCSLFVFSGDPADIRASVASWLPPESTGITVSEEALPSPSHLETIAYELRGGKVSERWVITTPTEASSSLKGILSWSRL